ncbi:MAG: CopD family protein [Betaproteobacteria bacterium]
MHVGIDALHLLGAGAWLGALVPLLLVVGRASATSEPAWHALAAQATRRFSALGLFSVLLLLVSGVLNAAWLVGGWTALGTTPYGRLVSAKIVLFALVIAIAAVNRLVLTPRLAMPAAAYGAMQALRRNVVAELVIGITIIAVVGVLGVTPPSAHEHMGGRQAMHADGTGVPVTMALDSRTREPALRARASHVGLLDCRSDI